MTVVSLLFPAALVSSCDGFRRTSSPRVLPLRQDESPALPHFIQELVRTKRHSVQELVRAQPHLVHDMGWPEIREISRSEVESNSSQLKPPSSAGQDAARTPAAVDGDVEEEMEVRRMWRNWQTAALILASEQR